MCVGPETRSLRSVFLRLIIKLLMFAAKTLSAQRLGQKSSNLSAGLDGADARAVVFPSESFPLFR